MNRSDRRRPGLNPSTVSPSGEGGLEALTPRILEQLMRLHSHRDLRRLLQDHPELNGAAMWSFLRRTGALNDPLLTAIVPLVILVRDAQRGDLEHAWKKYQRTKASLDERIATLHTEADKIEAMIEAGDFEQALAHIEPVKAMAESSGQILALLHLLSLEGRAAVLSRSANRAANLERAGVALKKGMELARASDQRELALALMMGPCNLLRRTNPRRLRRRSTCRRAAAT